MATERLGYALVGCGKFGRQCLEQYVKMDGLRPVAVWDSATPLARRMADEFGLEVAESLEALLARRDVHIVHFATPPGTHAAYSLRAIEAGKHVLCEKPLATSTADAERVAAAARQAGQQVLVNFVLRYSEIVHAVSRIIESGVLGRPLHAYFENYAQDETLPPTHWFWQRASSGGIFVEHGVHFFDLYRQWFGPGRIRSAHFLTRPGTGQEDRAFCAIGYDDLLALHYHGFDQPIRLDRQRHCILFQRGDVVVNGWIPLELEVYGVVDDEEAEALADLVPQGALTVLRRYTGDEAAFRARGQEHRVSAEVRLTWAIQTPKMDVYGELIRSLMADFIEAIRTGRAPTVTLEDAVEAVRMAEAATRAADAAKG